MEHEHTGEEVLTRGNFVRQIGLTFLAALGFVGASAAFAGEAQAACGTFCNLQRCNACNFGRKNLYYCRSKCTGEGFYACYDRRCRDFCLSSAC